ncbi:MAG: hypothetical protein RL318_579 [Fibrobacterota bacterium]|jgi:hypothetical protein
MILDTLATREHPCAPWVSLTESVKKELFPGGVGEDPLAYALRWSELQTRVIRVPVLPESIVASLAPQTVTAWEKIRAGAPVIMTGQQPVLGGGPHFIWLKVAGAIAAAKRASDAIGREVVPLFWIAGDDSDLPEVSSLPDPLSGEMLAASFDPAQHGHLVGDLPFAAGERERLSEAMKAMWPNTPAASIQRGSAGLSEALRRSLEHWFPDSGLAIVDAAWPGMRASFASSYAVFARHHETIDLALSQGIEAAKAAGLPVSLRSLPGRIRLFSLEDGVRTRLEAPEDPERLAQEIQGSPESFSHDAASRIFAAERAFPVLGHVLGPGEFAYVACLGRIQERLGWRIGTAIARPSLTVLPSDAVASAALAGFEFDRKCPASPKALELEYLRRHHPEVAAVGRFWNEARSSYLESIGEGADSGLGRRLATLEARKLARRLLEKRVEHPEESARLRGLWAWLGAGALQERAVPTWAIQEHLGSGAQDALLEFILQFDNSCHLVLEGP